jgi:hypothetical protein
LMLIAGISTNAISPVSNILSLSGRILLLSSWK